LQESILFEIDTLINQYEGVDEPYLAIRQANLLEALGERSKPPVFESDRKDNVLSQMRNHYASNLTAIQLEGLPATESTSSYQFWTWYNALEKKYKASK
jgi:hypothetical protein